MPMRNGSHLSYTHSLQRSHYRITQSITEVILLHLFQASRHQPEAFLFYDLPKDYFCVKIDLNKKVKSKKYEKKKNNSCSINFRNYNRWSLFLFYQEWKARIFGGEDSLWKC